MKALMYHYVRQKENRFPYFRYLDIKNFRKQLNFFEKKYGFVDYSEWCHYLENGTMPSANGKVLLTFDDADNRKI